jgi:RHS repeat-associated protein
MRATKYYRFNGELLAMRKNGVLTYLHQDQLGNVVLATDTSGNVVGDLGHWPYGKYRRGSELGTNNNGCMTATDLSRDAISSTANPLLSGCPLGPVVVLATDTSGNVVGDNGYWPYGKYRRGSELGTNNNGCMTATDLSCNAISPTANPLLSASVVVIGDRGHWPYGKYRRGSELGTNNNGLTTATDLSCNAISPTANPLLSASVVVIGDRGHWPYGKYRRGSELGTEHRFTGQKSDGTNLQYFNARYYDPELGIFISPDTLVPRPAGTRTNLFDYNRYMCARQSDEVYGSYGALFDVRRSLAMSISPRCYRILAQCAVGRVAERAPTPGGR